MSEGVRSSSELEKTATAAVEIRHVPFDAPWNWLSAGWRDLWATPVLSLTYGAAFCLAAAVLALAMLSQRMLPVLLPLAGGFLLLGPLLAVGLYEISRRRELGLPVTFSDIRAAARDSRGQLAFFGVFLLVIYFFWMRIAFLLFMLFYGPAEFPTIDNFIPSLLFTAHGLGLLVTGTAIGALLAAFTYAVSAISVPMLLDRKVDVATAVLTSMRAVALNFPAMALWAALIMGLCVAGFVALLIGLAITFPLIGHATWHAYRALTGPNTARF